MPYPKPNEKEQDFISRCIPYMIDEKNLNKDSKHDRDQATAICYSYWRSKNESIIGEFVETLIKKKNQCWKK